MKRSQGKVAANVIVRKAESSTIVYNVEAIKELVMKNAFERAGFGPNQKFKHAEMAILKKGKGFECVVHLVDPIKEDKIGDAVKSLNVGVKG